MSQKMLINARLPEELRIAVVENDALEELYVERTANDNYVGNNWAKMMCFLVEMGYLSNPAEEYLLVTPVYQQWLAEGMADGVYEIAVARGWVQAQ